MIDSNTSEKHGMECLKIGQRSQARAMVMYVRTHIHTYIQNVLLKNIRVHAAVLRVVWRYQKLLMIHADKLLKTLMLMNDFLLI